MDGRTMKTLRLYILAYLMIFCRFRYNYVSNECDSDYVNWLGITNYFEKLYWHYVEQEIDLCKNH